MCEIYLAQNIEHRTVKRFNSFYLTIQLKYFFVLIFLCIFFFCLKKDTFKVLSSSKAVNWYHDTFIFQKRIFFFDNFYKSIIMYQFSRFIAIIISS